MIQINLLPEELREKKKNVERVPLTKIGIGVGVFMTLLTIGFYIDFLFSSVKCRTLEQTWEKAQPESGGLTQLQSEVEGILKQEKEFMERFVTTPRPLTHILMWVNEFLPERAWLVEFKLEREEEGGNILVKGLALSSKTQSSIEQIEAYLQKLKEKMPETQLSLTTIRQTFEGVELTQFIANFDWGKKKKQ